MRSLRNLLIGRAAQRSLATLGNQVFLLRGDHVRAVEREDRLALLHHLAHEIDVDLFHEPGNLDVNVRDLRFVGNDLRRGAYVAHHRLLLHRRGPYAHHLLLARRDVDGSGRHVLAAAVVGILGHQVHAAVGSGARLV